MTMAKFVLALDQGTTSSRAIVFNRRGRIVATAQREFRQIFSQPGWVEHDAAEIWATQLECAQSALRQAGAAAADIAAIGVTNQRETSVVWERATGVPIANAIVWQDRRTAARCQALRDRGVEALVTATTGLLLDPYFSATKIEWLLDHVPGARMRAQRGELAFGTIDTWLIWNLTGGGLHVTDASNASRTLLLDLDALEWSDELLELFRVPREILPRVTASSESIGSTIDGLFGAPIRISGNAGDQQAATFGQACFQEGMAKNTIGTGAFMLMNVGSRPQASANRLLSTAGWTLANSQVATYMLEGSVFVAGAVVQWLRDGLGLFARSDDVEALARQVDDNGGVFLVPAFVGLGAPYWDPNARGTIVGLTRGTTKGHVALAALQSIAFQSMDVLTAMQRDARRPLIEVRVDGGAAKNDLLMQFHADISNVPVVRPEVVETTALGAAYLAGLATGFWSGLDEISSLWRADRRFEPAMQASQRDELVGRWHRAVERSQHWA
ncbi:MAG: glycerol kinase GlpK [Burkholderiaceae bacterium]